MGRQSRQAGFSTVELLLAGLAVVVIGAAGVFVYEHQHKTTPTTTNAATNSTQTTNQQQNTTGTQPQQTASLSTYTSTSGGFSFQYPSSWKVTEGTIPTPQGATEDEISISSSATGISVTPRQITTPNVYSMTLSIGTQKSGIGSAIMPDGTIQSSANGIPIWTASESWAATPTNPAGLTMCPQVFVASADKSNFTYLLPNGKNLVVQAGYCEGQGVGTSLTYQQQVASPDWQAGITLLQSIKFN
ncbi:MAG TPA: hypothetical protein VKT82_30655 [Ktedonobacterales bacterium]|nr:hypothetical protein [Ktedonobacterales bacterium]